MSTISTGSFGFNGDVNVLGNVVSNIYIPSTAYLYAGGTSFTSAALVSALNNTAGVDLTSTQTISGQKYFGNVKNLFYGNVTLPAYGNINIPSTGNLIVGTTTINPTQLQNLSYMTTLSAINATVDMTSTQSITGNKTFSNIVLAKNATGAGLIFDTPDLTGNIMTMTNISGVNYSFTTQAMMSLYNASVNGATIHTNSSNGNTVFNGNTNFGNTNVQPGVFIKGNTISVLNNLDNTYYVGEQKTLAGGNYAGNGYTYFRNCFYHTNNYYNTINTNNAFFSIAPVTPQVFTLSAIATGGNCVLSPRGNYSNGTAWINYNVGPIYQYYNLNVPASGGTLSNLSNPILFFPDPTADFVGVEITLIRSGTGNPFRLSTMSCNPTTSTFMINPGTIISPYFSVAATWNKLTLVCTPNFDSPTTSPYVWNQMYYQ